MLHTLAGGIRESARYKLWLKLGEPQRKKNKREPTEIGVFYGKLYTSSAYIAP
jgi:hypothetical protein